MSWTDKARISAAAQAVREIRDNTTIGLGSGNTVLRALELAAERVKKENLKITFIPTSYQTEIAAKKLGLKTSDLQEDTEPDLALDGADQIQWRTLDLVKGGGAALLREKIVDSTARRLIIVVDEKTLLREAAGKVGPVITDNGNLIADVYFRSLRRPEIVHEKLKKIPGVVETGLFLGMCDVAYVGRKDGRVDILRRG